MDWPVTSEPSRAKARPLRPRRSLLFSGSSKPMPKALYIQRKKGRYPAAHKAGSFLWMGCCIVRVHIPQMKHEMEGRKDPSAPSRKRSRGCRGRRRGSARVGKTRREKRSALQPAKLKGDETVSTDKSRKEVRAQKVRRRRMAWIEKRLSFVGDTPPDQTFSRRRTAPGRGFETRSLRKFRLARLTKVLLSKKTPMPPGMSVDDWVRRLGELKYGTWLSVSSVLTDGEHSLGYQFTAPPPSLTRRTRESDSRLSCSCCGYRFVYSRRPVCRRCGTSMWAVFRDDQRLREALPPLLDEQRIAR